MIHITIPVDKNHPNARLCLISLISNTPNCSAMENATLINTQMLFGEADQLLELAVHELERSEEDVVIPMVCFNTRQSIVNYMRGFLLSRGTTPAEPLTLDHLHKQCKRIHPAFQALDFSSFDCQHEDDSESYCLSVHKVEECLKTAVQTQSIVYGA